MYPSTHLYPPNGRTNSKQSAPKALISCMVLDVFHPWPRDALVGVAQRFMVVLSQNNIQDEENCLQSS